MLTGSPMLQRPHEIYTQVSAVLRCEERESLLEGWGGDGHGNGMLQAQINRWGREVIECGGDDPSLLAALGSCFNRLWGCFLYDASLPLEKRGAGEGGGGNGGGGGSRQATATTYGHSEAFGACWSQRPKGKTARRAATCDKYLALIKGLVKACSE